MSEDYAVFLDEAMGALNWAHQKAPGGLTILPPEIVDVKNADPANPKKRPATLTIAIPDQLASKLKADQEIGIIYICHVHHELVQMAAQRSESRLYLPGDD